MFRAIFRKIVDVLRKSFLRKSILSVAIFFHNKSYEVIKYFVTAPGKKHPKYAILNHEDFFRKNISKNDVVLDLGSGTGDLSYEISKIAKKVIGIEILKHKFNYSRNKFKNKNLQFIYGDATIFDFKKLGISKFDKVVLSNVLEHIDRRPEFLKSISRVSDIILLRVPLITRDWLAVYKKENGYYYKLDPTHFTEYTVEQVHDEAKKAGFRVKTYYTQFGEFYGVLEKNGKR